MLEVIPEEFVHDGSEEEGLLTGYTDNYLKVVFEGPESLIGQLVKVKLHKQATLTQKDNLYAF